MSMLAGCGYVGEPQYPALNIPNRVSTLGAVERGDKLDVTFTVPPLTTEGLVVKSVSGVDLRVGPSPAPFNVRTWADSATLVDVKPPEKLGLVQVMVPVDKFVDRDVIVAVRLVNAKKRVSEWSNLVTLHVEKPLNQPTNLMAIGAPDGVRLTWKAPGARAFRVSRSSDAEPQPQPIATATTSEYLDASAVYGKKYQYYVEAVNAAVVSETAGPAAVGLTDARSTGVTAGVDSIELTWERNTETDFRGYRIYRSIGTNPWERIADLVEAPNYTDRKVIPGTRYRYAVTSVDQTGNESERTTPVEAVIP